MYTHNTINSSLDYISTIVTLFDNSKVPGSSKSRVVNNAFQKAGEIHQPGITPLSEPFAQVKLYAFINAKNRAFSGSKTHKFFNAGNMAFRNIMNVRDVNHDAVSRGKFPGFPTAFTGR
jgi:hypothetical protein